MSLRHAANQLGWPEPKEVLSPRDDGARALVGSMQDKFQRRLRLETGIDNVKVGLLIPDETGESTPAPIAVVCEFARVPSPHVLEITHRIAWNYSKAPVLFTVDPHSIRAWTCCEIPTSAPSLLSPQSPEIEDARFDWLQQATMEEQTAAALHWVNLVSGNFFASNHQRFDSAGRLDQALIGNLKAVLLELSSAKLPQHVAHDLLGRIIFIQFLFQRTDSSGNAALNVSVLQRLLEQRILRKPHQHLASILADYDDTYRFFRWLNERFNGDLFPGKAANDNERETEWQQEIELVGPQHLNLLSEFVSGQMLLDSGQRSLFPLYSFDTIPLEFISSIYEEFVSTEVKESTGAHFTPGHLVDLVLDGVLPWGDSRWNLKVLDPACGSGIFLVKAFQRLLHRWKLANPDRDPAAAELKSILENNIFGVDVNPEAVRVASFSLYLAMCDEIDPKHYWTQVRFPRLRGRNLHAGDYFALDQDHQNLAKRRFDLIIGNAPWGQDTATSPAEEWAQRNDWSISYGSLGPLFLPRAADALNDGGTISMLQPASLLTNSVQTADKFRKRLFTTFKVDEVINLSALRFGLFANAVDPTCIITLRLAAPDDDFISYICPKPNRSSLDDYRISIDPQDVNLISPREAAVHTDVWTVLMWGNGRDLNLVRKLSLLPNLSKLENDKIVKTREGIIRGDKKKEINKIVGRRILEGRKSGRLPLELDPEDLPVNKLNRVDDKASTDFSAFTLPQMIIKQSWTKRTGRFEASLVRGRAGERGILCSQSYISVSSDAPHVLETACAVYNSIVSVYYLLLTSGRFSSYRPEPTATDLLRVPLPEGYTHGFSRLTQSTIDRQIPRLYGFSDSEWALIHDLFAYTLPDFKGDSQSPGRLPTSRGADSASDPLAAYCESIVRVLKSAFGKDKGISCTIYEEANDERLPVRLVLVHLEVPQPIVTVRHKALSCPRLLAEMRDIAQHIESESSSEIPIFRSRVVRVYTMLELEQVQLPSIVLIKPDQSRFWTQSAGLRDADEIASDFLAWSIKEKSEVSSRAQ